MTEDESLKRFQGLIKRQLAEEARAYEEILKALPENWVELLTEDLREGVQKGVNTWRQEIAEGLVVTVRLDFELGYRRGD